MLDVFSDLFVAIFQPVGDVISERVERRRERKAAAAGLAPPMHASIRRMNTPGWHGRWRHGFATVSTRGMAQEIRWRPRRPRPGPPIRLTNVQRVGGHRTVNLREEWWIRGGLWVYRVVSADVPTVEYELAVFSESYPIMNEIRRR